MDPDTVPHPAHRHAAQLLSRQLRQGARAARLQVQGDCMAPLVQENDEVVITPIAGRLRVGDLVLAAISDTEFVCHRVLAFAPDGTSLLAGDRSLQAQSSPVDALVGIVSEVRRGSRTLLLASSGGRYLDRVMARLHLAAVLGYRSRLRGIRLVGRGLQRAVLFLGWLRGRPLTTPQR